MKQKIIITLCVVGAFALLTACPAASDTNTRTNTTNKTNMNAVVVNSNTNSTMNSNMNSNMAMDKSENPMVGGAPMSKEKDIIDNAVNSKDHTTLVTAVKAAGLVDTLKGAGPFTVFAPTNAAFEKLPKGTVEGLLKPEKKDDLSNILGYHTYVGVLEGVILQDGAEYGMVYGGKVKITKQGEKTFVNGSEILASIKTSNGVIHVIGDVLLPK